MLVAAVFLSCGPLFANGFSGPAASRAAHVPIASAPPKAPRAATTCRAAAATATGGGAATKKKVIVFGGDGFCGWPTALHLSDHGALAMAHSHSSAPLTPLSLNLSLDVTTPRLKLTSESCTYLSSHPPVYQVMTLSSLITSPAVPSTWNSAATR